MKCSRFFLILNRGPPIDKGVLAGFTPRKDALFPFPGDVSERLLHPAVNRRSHGGGFPYQDSPVGVRVQVPSSPPLLLSIYVPGLAGLADALGLGPSWGCPVGRSPSPCEFKSR